MGATAAVEVRKPPDACDIRQTRDLAFARSEIVRLRKELGHLASTYGMNVLTMDASDLVLGKDEDEDFSRCVREISHIRRCMLLNTQTNIRQGRRQYERPLVQMQSDEEKEGGVDDDSSNSSSEDDN